MLQKFEKLWVNSNLFSRHTCEGSMDVCYVDGFDIYRLGLGRCTCIIGKKSEAA